MAVAVVTANLSVSGEAGWEEELKESMTEVIVEIMMKSMAGIMAES